MSLQKTQIEGSVIHHCNVSIFLFDKTDNFKTSAQPMMYGKIEENANLRDFVSTRYGETDDDTERSEAL